MPAIHRLIRSLIRKPRPPKPPRHTSVWLRINTSSSLLAPYVETFIMSNIRLDQTAALSVEALDAFGNPVPAVFDAPPVWANSNDAAATLAVTGNTAVLTPAAGSVGQSTTVSVVATIGGAPFSASIDYTVTGAAVASIRIVAVLNPP